MASFLLPLALRGRTDARAEWAPSRSCCQVVQTLGEGSAGQRDTSGDKPSTSKNLGSLPVPPIGRLPSPLYSSIDLDSTGRLPKSTVLTSLSTCPSSAPSGKHTYDAVRETLKTVSVDASGAVELDDFVDLVAKLKEGAGASAGQVHRGGALSGLMGGKGPAPTPGGGAPGAAQTGGGKVLVKGSNTNITHSINEDERTEFTRHINQVSFLRLLLVVQAEAEVPSSADRSSLAMPTSEVVFPFLWIRCRSLTSAEVSSRILVEGSSSSALIFPSPHPIARTLNRRSHPL